MCPTDQNLRLPVPGKSGLTGWARVTADGPGGGSIDEAGVRNRVEAVAGDGADDLRELRGLLAGAAGVASRPEEDAVPFAGRGWDSIQMARAASVVGEIHGVRLGLRDLLGPWNSVAAIARYIDKVKKAKPAEPAAGATVTGEAATEYPLTSGQQEILLHCLADAESALDFNECLTIAVDGALDPVRLAQAIDALSMRHPALRATIDVARGRQRIGPEPRLRLESAEAGSEARAMERIREWAARPFDLEAGPLGRVLLVGAGPDRQVLAVTLHHVIFDGWSCVVFCRELGVIYRTLAGDPAGPLPPPGDHAAFTRAETEAESAAFADPEADGFWSERLRSLPDAPRWPGQWTGERSHAADHVRLSMEGPACARLRAAAGRAGRTLFVQMLGGYLVWLHRLCGQDELLAGIPLAGQVAGGATDVIGHGVRFLPVRSRHVAGTTAGDYLAALSAEVSGVLGHGSCSAGALARHHGWGRWTTGGPLIPTSFSWVPRLPVVDFGRDGRGQARIAPKSHLGVPMALWVYQEGDQLTVECVFQKSRFDRATVAGWLDGFALLVDKMAAEPATGLRRLPMIGSAMAEKLESWGGRATNALRAPDSVIARFHAVAEARAASVAVIDGGRSWTYRELAGQSDSLAARLAGHGIAEGDRVAVVLPRSGEMIHAMLGVLRAGASYLPVDPAWPATRKADILRVAAPKVVIHRGPPDIDVPGAVWIDPDEADHGAGPLAALPAMPLAPDVPAYVMFTSGSTGRSKGVVVPHRGILRLVIDADWLDFGPDRVFLHASVPSFDASTLEIWGALLHGAKLVVAPPEATLETLAALIRGEKIDTAWFTAGLFQAMVADHPEALAGLKDLLAGGDVLPVAGARALLARYPKLRLTNGYGPTENTTFTTCHRVTEADLVATAIPIGKPIHGTTVRVVDDAGEPVPPGVIGELLAGGDGLAHGYLGDAEMTARVFVRIDVNGRSTRYYRTGDLVEWSPQGVLLFHGRRDTQIKIRGHRIEPAEVEALIAAHPDVRAVKVAARGEGAADKHLVAWVVGDADPARLRADWARSLPAHLLPDHVVVVDSLPVTAHGKIDVAALPEPAPAIPGPAGEFSPTGRQLAGWWAELLGRPIDSPGAHFFDCGGHSLLALRLFSRIHRETGLTPPLSLLLTCPVLGDLARALDAMRAEANGTPADAKSIGSLVTLRDTGSAAPVIFLHGGDGGVLFARKVTDNLRPIRPVHAIGSDRLGQSAPVEETTVESTADAYVALLSAMDAERPPVLIGYSFGGLVAWAMACRMESSGRRPELVVLIDTPNPEFPASPLPMVRRLGKFWRASTGRPLPARAGALVRRVVGGARTHLRVRSELRALAAAGNPPPHSDLRRVQVREVHTRAMEGFRPRDYHGRVVLLKARESHDKFDLAEDYHWGARACGGLSIISAPGDHLGLINETNAVALAAILDGILAPPPESPAASDSPAS